MKLRKFEILLAGSDSAYTSVDAEYIKYALGEYVGLYRYTIEVKEVEITEKEFKHGKNK